MIGMRTILRVADNSGARKLACILPVGGDVGPSGCTSESGGTRGGPCAPIVTEHSTVTRPVGMPIRNNIMVICR